MSTSEVVTYEREGGTAWVRLNRPERLNAVTPELADQLCAALSRGISDHVAALVLAGNGRAFCSGYDLLQPDTESPSELLQQVERIQDVTRLIQRSPHPVVAEVQGYALGAGCEFALSCDLVLASDTAEFGFPEVASGLSVTGGLTRVLPQRVGLAVAKELIFLGSRIDATRALKLGLVNHVLPEAELSRATSELASLLAAQPQLSLHAAKRALDRESSLEDTLQFEAETALALHGREQGRTATDEFRNRKPRPSSAGVQGTRGAKTPVIDRSSYG